MHRYIPFIQLLSTFGLMLSFATASAEVMLIPDAPFTCSPLYPRAGSELADLQMLTCVIGKDVYGPDNEHLLYAEKSKLVGFVHGNSVRWTWVVKAGEHTEIQAVVPDTSNVSFVSTWSGTELPAALTVVFSENAPEPAP